MAVTEWDHVDRELGFYQGKPLGEMNRQDLIRAMESMANSHTRERDMWHAEREFLLSLNHPPSRAFWFCLGVFFATFFMMFLYWLGTR